MTLIHLHKTYVYDLYFPLKKMGDNITTKEGSSLLAQS